MVQRIACLLLVILPVFCRVKVQAQDYPFSAALDSLRAALSQSAEYDAAKTRAIAGLRQKLQANNPADLAGAFGLYAQLFEAYKVYQYDSAYHYAQLLLQVSKRLNDPESIGYARIKLGFSMLSSGMYKETLDSLRTIVVQAVPNESRAEYYALMGRYYYDLADYDNDQYHSPGYNQKAAAYIDSALALWSPDSYAFQYYCGLRWLRSGNRTDAKTSFDNLLLRPQLTDHQIAVTASTLSDLHIQNGNDDSAITCLIRAMIADIRSSTKETSAAFILSTLLNKKGDIRHASLCINKAFEDAVFYGARQRKMQVSAVLPLIEAQKFAIVEGQKTRLAWYAGLVTFLLLLVLALAYIVYKQVNKLKQAQAALLQAHSKTQEINRTLAETNEKLNDANKIKEEYIGYFFNVNSAFYDKIDRFKKLVEQKIATRSLDEIRYLVKNIDLKKEKEDLLKNFDHAFLRLFPNFVQEYNSLFAPEDQVHLKDDELLNTDLRIFALARIGIHENEKIAHILQYSVNTINTYKTRIKNKSLVPNDAFEKHIMGIKTV